MPPPKDAMSEPSNAARECLSQARPAPDRDETPQGFLDWFARNYNGEVVFSDPDWHARIIFRTAVWHFRAIQAHRPTIQTGEARPAPDREMLAERPSLDWGRRYNEGDWLAVADAAIAALRPDVEQTGDET